MNRRSLLLGLGAIIAAPAVVRAESLMKLWVPPKPSFALWEYTTVLEKFEAGTIYWLAEDARGIMHVVDKMAAPVSPYSVMHDGVPMSITGLLRQHTMTRGQMRERFGVA
jgi:hypothetical protein